MEDILNLLPLAVLMLLIGLDFAKPARAFPRMRFWRLKGAAFFVATLAVGISAPLLWDGLFAEYRLIDATGLGIAGGAVVGILVAQLVSYGWHRLMHHSSLLWRWFHQMHHSAERLDIWSAFIFSPLDNLGFAMVGSLALVLGVGISGEAALVVNTFFFCLAMFQHANIKTPRWLGYFIQRPENHAVHHQRGVHAYNYGDIALWDMVFGTWKNPETFEGEVGFYEGASRRVGAMLIGRDVSAPAKQVAVVSEIDAGAHEPVSSNSVAAA